MQDGTLVVIALVGLALVCVGVLFVAFLLLLRFAGSRPLGLLSTLLGDRDDDRDGGRILTTPRPDLRAIAQANDFDTALAKHVVQDEIEPRIISQPSSTQSAAPDPTFGDVPSLRPRRTDRQSNVRRDDDDDMFGDMLD